MPPEITEEELVATISQTHIQRTKWRSFQAGKRYKGEAKPSLNSRCYFQFETLEQAEDFVKDYHGHQFVDGHGESFRAVACFAPYQKVPRQKSQKDPRDGTIFDDPTYKDFLESLEGKRTYEAPPDPKVLLKPLDYGDTPLLNFMKKRSTERRARFEKREKKRWGAESRGLEQIDEEPKKAKWRCAECGTSKHLEEDPDDRGTFYCTYCWDSWESHQAPAPKLKKKKKGKDVAEDEGAEGTEESTSKRKKKKKEKEHEDWHATDKAAASGSWAVEEELPEGRRRKKKDREKERAEEDEGSYGGKHRWRVKKSEDGYDQDWDAGKQRSKEKDGQEEWWEEDRSHKRSERRSEKSDHGGDDSYGARWRAKGSGSSGTVAAEVGGEREEKPRRNRKEKKAEGNEGGYWRPKS